MPALGHDQNNKKQKRTTRFKKVEINKKAKPTRLLKPCRIKQNKNGTSRN